MKAFILILIGVLTLPIIALADDAKTMETNCKKDVPKVAIVPHKRKPVRTVPPPRVIEKEVVKEVMVPVPTPVIVEKEVKVLVPQPIIPTQPRPHYVDDAYSLDTTGLPYPPVNPHGSLLNHGLTGAAVTGAIVYGLSR